MNNKFKISSIRLNLCTILFILFLVLKLTGNIDWTWWWVTAPLWIPLGLVLAIFLMVIVVFWILDLLK